MRWHGKFLPALIVPWSGLIVSLPALIVLHQGMLEDFGSLTPLPADKISSN